MGPSGRGQGSGKYSSKDSNRDYNKRGHSYFSFWGNRDGEFNKGSLLEYKTYLSKKYINKIYFYTYPELAPKAFINKYSDNKLQRVALLLYKAENTIRRNNKNQKK